MKRLILLLLIAVNTSGVFSQTEIKLYTSVPNAKQHNIQEIRREDKDVKLAYLEQISDPFLIVFNPVNKNGTGSIPRSV